MKKREPDRSSNDPASDKRFSHILTIRYGEMIEFVLSSLSVRSAVLNLYYILIIVSVAVVAWVIRFSGSMQSGYLFDSLLIGLILVPLALIPLHEAIHILVLIIGGARDIRAGVDLKQFIVYVTSHKHIVYPNHFIVTALSPMIIVSGLLIAVSRYIPLPWNYGFLIAVPVHLTMCAGDIALVNFYYNNRDKRIVTWDDADNKSCSFFEIKEE